jgi:hypothetical protein
MTTGSQRSLWSTVDILSHAFREPINGQGVWLAGFPPRARQTTRLVAIAPSMRRGGMFLIL